MRGASPIDIGPPTRCQRFLRAELIGLRDGTFDTADADITFCPSGWALADDVCVRRASASVYECLDDPEECRVQCDRGSAPSCTRLGYLLAHGEAGFVRDETAGVDVLRAGLFGRVPTGLLQHRGPVLVGRRRSEG